MTSNCPPLARLGFGFRQKWTATPRHATFLRMLDQAVSDTKFMRQALALARRALGCTSPNPMVGAILVKSNRILGRGWHHRAGLPHAEIEALRDAAQKGHSTRGATLYVTLEPCSTHGRTPPCTDAVCKAGIRRVVVAATDPNPVHAGGGLEILRRSGIEVATGILEWESNQLNEAFNHWIVHKTPFVTVKAAMTMDGKIATAGGESKWITSPASRQFAMRLRRAADAILVGVNTVIADNPSLTVRSSDLNARKPLGRLRIVLDPRARTPLNSEILTDAFCPLTRVIVTDAAPRRRIQALEDCATVVRAPSHNDGIDLPWLLQHLGVQGITNLLVEGGGETHAHFLNSACTHRVAFFYAPKIVGGRTARRAAAGDGARRREDFPILKDVRTTRVGPDLFYTARVASSAQQTSSQA